MDSLLFIITLACLFVVAGWYVGNELRGAQGDWGFLAILPDISDGRSEGAASYRMKPPRAKGPGQVRPPSSAGTDAGEGDGPAYTAPGKARRFHQKHAALYRAHGPLPRFGERSGLRPTQQGEPPDGERD